MAATRIDLSQEQKPLGRDLSGLKSHLAQLVGEPFRLGRVSYGDELTLHFGDLTPARSPKLKGNLYGAYILGLRASPWTLKSGSKSVVLTAGDMSSAVPPQFGAQLSKEELESGRFIEPESRVLSATPFLVKPAEAFGLELRMSDGSSLLVLPRAQDEDRPEDERLPMLADWELSSPHGVLRAGPGAEWSFEPLRSASPGRKRDPDEIFARFDRTVSFESNAELFAFAKEMKAQQYARMFENEDEDTGMRIKRLWSFHDQAVGQRFYARMLELPEEDRKIPVRKYSRFLEQIRAVRKAMADYLAGQQFFEFYAPETNEDTIEIEVAMEGLSTGDNLLGNQQAEEGGVSC